MACRLFSAKPLSESVLGNCKLEPSEQTRVIFKSKYKTFHSRKYIWKCCLRNEGHNVQEKISLKIWTFYWTFLPQYMYTDSFYPWALRPNGYFRHLCPSIRPFICLSICPSLRIYPILSLLIIKLDLDKILLETFFGEFFLKFQIFLSRSWMLQGINVSTDVKQKGSASVG